MHHHHRRHTYTHTPFMPHTFSIIMQCHEAQINLHSATNGMQLDKKPFWRISLHTNCNCNPFFVCLFCSFRFSNSRSSHEIGRGSSNFSAQQQRGLYLELERERGCLEGSPPSDNVMFDNQCYATTPSSSNGNSDQDQPYGQRQGSNRHQHHHQVFAYWPIFNAFNWNWKLFKINFKLFYAHFD